MLKETYAPKVTLVVPTFNRLNLLKRLLNNLGEQTYKPIEIIIIDNGSTDGTDAYLYELRKTDGGILFFRFNDNTGSPMACYNKGIESATGEYIGFIYDDDTLFPDAVEFLISKAIALKSDWVVANCADSRTGCYTYYGPLNDCEISFDDVLSEKFTGEAWSLIRRTLFDGIRFDEKMYGGESSVWLQIYKKTNAHYFHRAVRYYYKDHGGNVTGIKAIIQNSKKLYYTECKYIELFHNEFEYAGILPKKYFRLALLLILSKHRKKSLSLLPEYFSLSRLHWLLFHFFLLMVPQTLIEKALILRARLKTGHLFRILSADQ